jgi:hypothetical protein
MALRATSVWSTDSKYRFFVTNLHPDFARDAIRSQFIRLDVANRGRNVIQSASLMKASTNFLWIIFYMDTGERIEVKITEIKARQPLLPLSRSLLLKQVV